MLCEPPGLPRILRRFFEGVLIPFTKYARHVGDVRLGVGRSCAAVNPGQKVRAETVGDGLR